MKVKVNFKKSYLAVINNSIGAKTWRTMIASIDGREQYILAKGQLSCAFFVSSILYIFKLIKSTHATVDSTVNDLIKSGWTELKKPRIGSILVWEEKELRGSINKHIGFYIGKNKAISNSSTKKAPVNHHFTFGKLNKKPKRRIELVLWHNKLE